MLRQTPLYPSPSKFAKSPGPIDVEGRQERITEQQAKLRAARAFAEQQAPEDTNPRGTLIREASKALRIAVNRAGKPLTLDQVIKTLSGHRATIADAAAIDRVIDLFKNGRDILQGMLDKHNALSDR